MKYGAGFNSKDLSYYHNIITGLPVINIENCLTSQCLENTDGLVKQIRKDLGNYGGDIILDAPDLEPYQYGKEIEHVGLNKIRVIKTMKLAQAIGASDIIFQSTLVSGSKYDPEDADWIKTSIDFWYGIIPELVPGIICHLCNSGLENPESLIQLAESIKSPKFRLAFDIGHFLARSKAEFEIWASYLEHFCNILFIHSNNGEEDTHEAPSFGIFKERVNADALKKHFQGDVKMVLKISNKTAVVDSIRWLRDKGYL